MWLPYIWTIVLLKLISVIKVVQDLLLSRLACCILNLADKHGITLISAYIPTNLNVETHYLSQGQLVSEWHLFPCIAQAAFHLWGKPEVDL